MNRRTYLAISLAALAGVSAVRAGGHVASANEDDWEEIVRGENNVDLSVHEEEDDEHVEYSEEDDEVKFVAAMSRDEPVRYGTTAWERWGQRRCTAAAAPEAARYVGNELGVDVGFTISGRVEGEDLAAVVSVYEDEGVTLDELAAATPSTVDATYELDDRTFEMAVLIYARVRPEVVMPDDAMEGDDAIDGVLDDADDGTNGGAANETNGGEDDGMESDEDDTNADAGDDEADGSGPGFGVGGAFVALGGLYVYARQRIADDEKNR